MNEHDIIRASRNRSCDSRVFKDSNGSTFTVKLFSSAISFRSSLTQLLYYLTRKLPEPRHPGSAAVSACCVSKVAVPPASSAEMPKRLDWAIHAENNLMTKTPLHCYTRAVRRKCSFNEQDSIYLRWTEEAFLVYNGPSARLKATNVVTLRFVNRSPALKSNDTLQNTDGSISQNVTITKTPEAIQIQFMTNTFLY